MWIGHKILSMLFFFALITLSFSIGISEVTQKVNDLHLLKSSDIDGVAEEMIISQDSVVNLSGTLYWVISIISGTNSTNYFYIVINDKKPLELVDDAKYEQIIKQKVFFDYLSGKELYYSSSLTNYFLNLSSEIDKMSYNIDLFEKYLEDENINISNILVKISSLNTEINLVKSKSELSSLESNNLDGILISLKKEIPGNLSSNMYNSAKTLSEYAKEIYSGYNSIDSKIQLIKSSLVDLNIDISKKSVLVNFLSISPQLQAFSSKKEVIDSSYSNIQKAYNQAENKAFMKKLVDDWKQRGYRSEWFSLYYLEDKDTKLKTKYSSLDLAVSYITQTSQNWTNPDALSLSGKKNELLSYVNKGNYKDALELSKEIKASVLAIYSAGQKPIEQEEDAQDNSYLYYILFGVVGLVIIILGYKIFKKYATKEEPQEEDEEYKI